MGEAPDPNTVIVDPREGGQKLLQFLQRRLDLPPSLLHRWIRTGQVRINGGRAKPFGLVAAGDSVRLPPFAGARPRGARPPRNRGMSRVRGRRPCLRPPAPCRRTGTSGSSANRPVCPRIPAPAMRTACPVVWRPERGMPRSSPRPSIGWTRIPRASCWWPPALPSCAS